VLAIVIVEKVMSVPLTVTVVWLTPDWIFTPVWLAPIRRRLVLEEEMVTTSL
jgi:hypothetical protein